MLERELALAGQPRLGARSEDVLALEPGQRLAEVAALLLGHRRQRALPERAAHHARLLHQPALERAQRVQPRGQHRLHRVGQLHHAVALLLGDAAHHLLGEQRVAARALGHLGREVAPRVVVAEEGRPPAGGSRRRRAGRGRSGSPCAARRPSRRAARAARRAPGTAAAAGRAPTGRGARSRRACRRRPSGCPRTPARAARAPPRPRSPIAARRRTPRASAPGPPESAGTCSGGHVEAERARDLRRVALGRLVREDAGHVAAELRPGLVGAVGVDDAGLGAQHLAQRPVDDAGAVGQAAPGLQRRPAPVDPAARTRAAGATCPRPPRRSASPGAACARARSG